MEVYHRYKQYKAMMHYKVFHNNRKRYAIPYILIKFKRFLRLSAFITFSYFYSNTVDITGRDMGIKMTTTMALVCTIKIGMTVLEVAQ